MRQKLKKCVFSLISYNFNCPGENNTALFIFTPDKIVRNVPGLRPGFRWFIKGCAGDQFILRYTASSCAQLSLNTRKQMSAFSAEIFRRQRQHQQHHPKLTTLHFQSRIFEIFQDNPSNTEPMQSFFQGINQGEEMWWWYNIFGGIMRYEEFYIF